MHPKLELIPLRTGVAMDRPSSIDLLVRVVTPELEPTAVRPPLNLGLVIDRSGSMEGAKLHRAREAATYLVERLHPTDRVAVTVFDTRVHNLVPSTFAEERESIIGQIRRIESGSSTALHAGWLSGASEVSRHLDSRQLNRVILLSDGLANVGETNPDRIARDVHGLAQRGVSTSALGIGDDYDENLMESMAKAGDGNFCHIERPDQLPGIFTAELMGLAATVGSKVSLGLEPAAGVRVEDVLNDLEPNEFGRLKLANLVRGLPTRIAVRLRVPPCPSEADLVRFRLAWDDPGTGQRKRLYAVLRLPVLPSSELDKLPANPEVEREFALLGAARVRREAIRFADMGNYGQADSVLRNAVDYYAPQPYMAAEVAQLQDLQADLSGGRSSSFRKKAMYQAFTRERSKER